MKAIGQQFLCCCYWVKIPTSKHASLQIKDENRTCLLGSVLLSLVSSTIQPQGFALQRNEDIYKNKQIGKQDKQRKKLKRRKIPEYCNATYTTPNGQFLSTYKPLLTPSPTARHDPQCPLVAASNQYLNAALCQREVKQNPFSRVKISCFTLHRVFVVEDGGWCGFPIDQIRFQFEFSEIFPVWNRTTFSGIRENLVGLT